MSSATATKSAEPAGETLSPHAVMRPISLTSAQWTNGFWADRFAVTRDSLVPAMGRLMSDTERFRWLGNFETAIGIGDGVRHRGPKWNDGDFYKWLESAAAIYAFTKDTALAAEMDACIDLIGKAQQPDGYIHTPQQIDARFGGSQPRFADPMHFEMYNMGHLILAGLAHHTVTGKDSLLKIAIKAADFLDRQFAHPTADVARHGICPSHLVALTDLYRLTKNIKYLNLAERLLNMRDLVTKGDDDNQDRIPFRQQRTAHGHAVRATYLYAGATDIYTETGDKSLMQALQPIWTDLVDRKLYITGGCGALFDGASPDGSADQANITRVHQAFGRDYQLPHSTAHNETCAAIGNILWNWRMLLATGESRFGDLIESTLLNSVLAGVSLDGRKFFYTNTLRRLEPMPVKLRFDQERKETLGCYCCPPNVARTMAQASTYAYAQTKDGVACVLYGGSRLQTTLADGSSLALVQETEYPWDGRIRITIEDAPATPFALSLRIPAWVKSPTLAINGKKESVGQRGAFHIVDRVWRAGDVVELNLPMTAHLVAANPYVEDTLGQAALVRGPLAYCVESADLPSGVRVTDLTIPADATFVESRDASLADAVVLKTRAFAVDRGERTGSLYRELSNATAKPIDIRFIPYFAWDNRGSGEMTVWLPVRH